MSYIIIFMRSYYDLLSEGAKKSTSPVFRHLTLKHYQFSEVGGRRFIRKETDYLEMFLAFNASPTNIEITSLAVSIPN